MIAKPHTHRCRRTGSYVVTTRRPGVYGDTVEIVLTTTPPKKDTAR